MSLKMTPVLGFWVGAVSTVVGLAAGLLLFPLALTLGGQSLASNKIVYFVVTVFPSVIFPIGLTLMVMSLIARALTRRPETNGALLAGDLEDEPSLPPRFSARNTLVTGLAVLVLGLVFRAYFADWFQAIQADETFLRDFVVYLGPLLNELLVPLGVLLIPCAWILRSIEERRLPNTVEPQALDETR